MERNRIQKLLLSEYKDFSDMVLVESPFAETTRNGRGVREVALGLTTSKLIIAADILRNSNDFTCPSDLDPSIETLELISVYPLKYITLSIFRRRQRKTLKARLIDGRANYFELGGMNRREIFWSVWCEHIRILLSQKEHGSSLSETSAASSSSISTLYFQSSDVDDGVVGHSRERHRCVCRLWAHYCGAGDIPPTWTRKDIYMGPSHSELGPDNYLPVPIKIHKTNIKHLRNELQISNRDISTDSYQQSSGNGSDRIASKKFCKYNDDLCHVLFVQENNPKKHLERGDYTNPIDESSPIITKNKRSSKSKREKKLQTSSRDSDHFAIPKLSRFGFGVEEKCTSGLYLPSSHKTRRSTLNKIRGSEIFMDPYQIIESGVAIWEQDKWRRNDRVKNQTGKFRRYGLATAPHFLYALGPWSVHEGDKISIQSKRSLSSVNIRRQPLENELKLPISKRQLATSVSMSSLDQNMSLVPSERGRVLLFWTPDYWYRPRAAIVAYRELRQHLDSIRSFQQKCNAKSCRNFFSRKNNKHCGDDNYEKIVTCDKATCILNKIFSMGDGKKKKKIGSKVNPKATDKLRNLLRMNLRITAWDLDSTILAKQLTLIDRELFLRIPVTEIKILIYQKSSRNAPNIGALIAFSHRISCLIASELLAISELNMRARILARFVNAANKCFAMGNFQSCRSILAGLQSPAIYRLKLTWSHLKTHHSSNYEIMSKLCKTFKSPRTKIYTKAWEDAERCPPLLPYIGDILIRILGLDKNSNSLFCECPERIKITKPEPVKKNWDGGATFITQMNEVENNSINRKTNLNVKTENGKSDNTKKIMCKCKREMAPITKRENIAKKLISSTLIRLRYGKYTPMKSSRKSICWAATQLILARRYYERWQTFVMTARIIVENEKQRRTIDMKRKKVDEVTSWLTMCQRYAHEYDFSPHTLAWEFLLKTRYREERENFYLSRKLEPLLD